MGPPETVRLSVIESDPKLIVPPTVKFPVMFAVPFIYYLIPPASIDPILTFPVEFMYIRGLPDV